jgi:hypothetical protein
MGWNLKILLFVCLLLPAYLFADTYWEDEYKKLCTYDQAWCYKLKNKDGTFVKPKKEILKLLKELGPTINEHATKLGVDPVAIAGAIMAENSLNVSVSDGVQDLLVKIGVANKGEVLGKKFTYGLGQLNFPVAREAEDYMAKIENRPPLTDSALSDALLVPGKAVYYVGAVIRKVQDEYKEEGFDIAGKPEVLTTVYNLGGAKTRAQAAKVAKTEPRQNYFGYFVDRYSYELGFLKPTEVKKPAAPVTKVVIAEPTSPTSIPISEPKVLSVVFDKSKPLYSSPPTCAIESGYGATDIKAKYQSMRSYPVSVIADKGTTFKSLVPTVDCEAESWQLLELPTGEVGWIKTKDLETSTSTVSIVPRKCTKKVDAACLGNIRSKLDKSFLSEEEGMVYIKPFTKSETADFTKPDWECIDASVPKEASFGLGFMGSLGNGSNHNNNNNNTNAVLPPPPYKNKQINSLKDLKATQKAVENQISKIEKFSGSKISSPKNIYSSIKLGIGYGLGAIQDCINKQEALLQPCQLDLKKVKTFYESLPLKKKIGKQELNAIEYNAQRLATSERLLNPEEVQKIKDTPVYGYGAGGYGGLAGFGGPYGGVVGGANGGGLYSPSISSQYQIEEGDLEKWSNDDIASTVENCMASNESLKIKIENSKSLSDVEKTNILSALGTLIENSNQVKIDLKRLEKLDEQKRAMIKPYLIQASKVCLGLMDIYDTKKDHKLTKTADEFSCYHEGLEVLDKKFEGLLPRQLVKELSLSPENVMYFSNEMLSAYPRWTIDPLLTPVPPPVVAGEQAPPEPDGPLSYCPNKTAEMIEELIKENPCVKKVFVPDEWLISRLNELAPKVIRRPFEKTDRFAVSVEEVTCQD